VKPVGASIAICVLPAAYFLALGLFESNWRASDTALVGVGLAFLLCLGLSSWVRRRRVASDAA